MKGISHFAAGVAVASCFPEAVRAGANGAPLYFVLGGVFGLLPDTADFKLYRFLYRHDVEVVPDPLRPDARIIAEAVAVAANRAAATGKPCRLKLNTVRLGPDAWQRYSVAFDVAGNKVAVRYGPVVDTGQRPIAAAPPGRLEATAPLAAPVKLDYQAETAVDIFDGPTFEMVPMPDGRVQARFIPWHREWSHSLAIAAALGLIVWPLLGALAGVVAFGAMSAHVLMDQMGFLGSNLFFPFTRRRTQGLKLMHSGEMWPNFAAVWLSCLVIFWNLYRAMPWDEPPFNFAQLLLTGAGVPLACAVLARGGLRALLARRAARGPG